MNLSGNGLKNPKKKPVFGLTRFSMMADIYYSVLNDA